MTKPPLSDNAQAFPVLLHILQQMLATTATASSNDVAAFIKLVRGACWLALRGVTWRATHRDDAGERVSFGSRGGRDGTGGILRRKLSKAIHVTLF